VKTTIRIEGLRELDAALGQLPKATGKNVLRRVLRKRVAPMAEQMKSLAPADEGDLKRGIGVGTRLTRRQASLHRKMFRNDRASVEMFAGAGGHPQAHLREWGSDGHPPHPFARPAWDAHQKPILEGIKDDLWREIDLAAQRLARKAARLAKKGR
jgi:HK97 gp10 family phage protein